MHQGSASGDKKGRYVVSHALKYLPSGKLCDFLRFVWHFWMWHDNALNDDDCSMDRHRHLLDSHGMSVSSYKNRRFIAWIDVMLLIVRAVDEASLLWASMCQCPTSQWSDFAFLTDRELRLASFNLDTSRITFWRNGELTHLPSRCDPADVLLLMLM